MRNIETFIGTSVCKTYCLLSITSGDTHERRSSQPPTRACIGECLCRCVRMCGRTRRSRTYAGRLAQEEPAATVQSHRSGSQVCMPSCCCPSCLRTNTGRSSKVMHQVTLGLLRLRDMLVAYISQAGVQVTQFSRSCSHCDQRKWPQTGSLRLTNESMSGNKTHNLDTHEP